MIAETVYPIVQALPKDEQIRLYEQLEKDLQRGDEPREMTHVEKVREHYIKELSKILYPPK